MSSSPPPVTPAIPASASVPEAPAPAVIDSALAPAEFDLTTDEKGRLVLVRPGMEDLAEVRLRRSFPWSYPDRYISLRAKDGKEIFIIDALADLAPALADKIRAALHSASLIPKIKRITKLDMRFGHQEWEVETDRGPAQFRVQEREDVRFLHDGRFAVKDADGNIYELPPESKLDAMTLKHLEPFI